MDNRAIDILVGAVAVIGSGIACFIFGKNKGIKDTQKKADEEIKSVVDSFTKLAEERGLPGFNKTASKNATADISKKLGDIPKSKKSIEPEIVSSDYMAETLYDYDTIGLTYYCGDHTLVDDQKQPIDPEDIPKMIGTEALEKITPNGDSVWVRNDINECFYEIVPDERSYGSILAKNPDLRPVDGR